MRSPKCGKDLNKSKSCEDGKVINILICYWCNYTEKEKLCY